MDPGEKNPEEITTDTSNSFDEELETQDLPDEDESAEDEIYDEE